MKLEPSAWLDRPGIKRLLKALDARSGHARFVGGAVRDLLLNEQHSDLDLATTHSPQEVVSRLEASGIKAVPTGIEHGTITAVSSNTVVEVTTLRSDVSTDGRRATVAFTDEASARSGEQGQMPADVQDDMAQAMSDVEFLDLHHPWFASHR